MGSAKGHSARDVDCPTCGSSTDQPCRGIDGYHQARINAAAMLTRQLNQAARAAAKGPR